ncbi:winged helix-turn-helix domain-containing protein [soil metagenome]
MPPATVSAAQARRISLAAQGFGRPRVGEPGIRQLDALVHRLGLLQIDSVNVFERSHYLPAFARLGGYDKALLDRLTFGRNARYTETWAHVASIIPLEDWPLWRWKMERNREKQRTDAWVLANGEMLDWLRAELKAKGPLAAGKIEHESNRGKGSWWGWSDVKLGLEYLFLWGEVVSAGRKNFERIYGLTEQVLPPAITEADIPREVAVRELLLRASAHHGIGTVGDLGDYYRIMKTQAAPILRDLAEDGELVPVTVDGWEQNGKPLTAYLNPQARIPRKLDAAALLSPFDPVVWERDRALRLFDFHYRIEIYTPEPKRIYGYYTLPVLVDDQIVGRIDLKNDRQNRVLRVQSAWREPHAPADVEQRIVPLLEATRAWQGLDSVEFAGRGDLSPALEAAWRAAR